MATLPELLKTMVELEGSDLHIATNTPPQILVSTLRRTSAGEFEFALAGTVGANYEIQVSNDLKTWDTMMTVPMTNSPLWCSDTVTNLPSRFYRAKLAH